MPSNEITTCVGVDMATLALRGTEWAPDTWSVELDTAPESFAKKVDEASDEALKGCIWSAVAVSLQKITRLSFFQIVFVAGVSYSVTQTVRLLFSEIGAIKWCEEETLRLVRQIPYLKIAITLVALFFLRVAPIVSVTLALGLGVLQGLTHNVHVLGSA